MQRRTPTTISQITVAPPTMSVSQITQLDSFFPLPKQCASSSALALQPVVMESVRMYASPACRICRIREARRPIRRYKGMKVTVLCTRRGATCVHSCSEAGSSRRGIRSPPRRYCRTASGTYISTSPPPLTAECLRPIPCRSRRPCAHGCRCGRDSQSRGRSNHRCSNVRQLHCTPSCRFLYV